MQKNKQTSRGKNLSTYQEELKKRARQKFAEIYGPHAEYDEELDALLTSSTTEAYVLGLKRALELLPTEKESLSPKLKEEGFIRAGFNSCRTEIETAITEELKKHSV